MPERFVTVATYGVPLEAEMAKNLLETEGIASFLDGELTALAFVGNSAMGQIRLQVSDQDAPRAAALLAAHAAEATLDADWETQAEEGAGVWICSLCGTPVSDLLTVCFACQTRRTDIRAAGPGRDTRLQDAPPSAAPANEGIQRRDDITERGPKEGRLK